MTNLLLVSEPTGFYNLRKQKDTFFLIIYFIIIFFFITKQLLDVTGIELEPLESGAARNYACYQLCYWASSSTEKFVKVIIIYLISAIILIN